MFNRFFIFMVAAMVAARAAGAATQCVALDASGATACTQAQSMFEGLDWVAKCMHNGQETVIHGVGFCASNSGTVGNTNRSGFPLYQQSFSTSCWCRIIAPMASKWIYAADLTVTSHGCAADCSGTCARLMAGTDSDAIAVRAGLFNNILDYSSTSYQY